MNARLRAPSVVSLLVLALLVLIASPGAADAQYIGREPARLAALLERGPAQDEGHPSAAAALETPLEAPEQSRLERAVKLLEERKSAEALEELGPASDHDSLRLRYARVLLRLHAARELQFSELRSAIAAILQADPFFRDAFDVWLGLNPTKKELQAYLAAQEPRTGSRAAWQRAEVLLRLGDARRALDTVRTLVDADPTLRNRIDRVLARAHFQSKADAAGQAVYFQLLDRLDTGTADLLFQDIAAIASASERREYTTMAPDDRPEFFRRFWAARHPVPVEVQNPRLAEHYRRLAGALAEYGLQSNGRGFFTDPEVFQSFTPKLSYFDSMVLFEDGPASRYWLDPRGLLLVRHGEPDRQIGPRSFAGTKDSESWAVSRFRSRPLIYHFVKRPPVGEWTLVLNLAVAAAGQGAIADDPEKILPTLSLSVYGLYESRLGLHPIYQQATEARSQSDLGRVLRAESELMAAYLKAALTFDSTSYYTKDNTIPMAVSIANFYANGKPAINVHFAVDLSIIDIRKLGEQPSLDATVMVYDRNFATLRRRVEKTFPLEPPRSGKSRGFVGRLSVTDLEPEDYRIVLFVYQRDSGRIGLARGGHEVAYIHDGSLGISDLVLWRQPGAKTRKADVDAAGMWVPVPEGIVSDSAPFRIDFELYNLQPDDSGQVRYEVEERVLTLYEEPGLLGKLAGYGNLVGQILFPLYTFAGQVGAQVLSQASASETDGLTVAKRLVEKPPASPISEKVDANMAELKAGVYTVYVTVRDLRTREVVSRFFTFQIDG